MLETSSDRTLPRFVDPRKFAQQGINIEGVIHISDLERIAESQVRDNPEVAVKLQFDVDEQKHRVITGQVSCQVQSLCQRCLEPVLLDLDCTLSLGVVWDEEQAKQLPVNLDPCILPEDGNTDIYQVVEEELLLAMPMVAYHDHDCIDKSLYSCGTPAKPEPKENPFKVLEQLKGTPK